MHNKRLVGFGFSIMLMVLLSNNTVFAKWDNVTPAISTQTLYGVWGTSATDVYAVGYAGTILHYNGTDWSEETSNTESQLLAVWGSSAANIYAVGKEDAVDSTATLLHKTASGTTWGKEALKDYKTDVDYNHDLFAVFGYAANAVYLGVRYGDVMRFDGTGWSTIEPNPYVGSCDITGIWAVNSTNVYIIDACSNDVSHYDGIDWPYDNTGHTGNLKAIWGSSLTDIYVAGTAGFISRYNGAAWLGISSGTSKDLNSLHGSSETNIFAVGKQGAIVHKKSAEAVFVDESFNTANDLFGVWASSDGQTAFAVGTDGMILKYTPDPVTSTTTTTTDGGGSTTTTTVSGGGTTTTTTGGGTTSTIPGGTSSSTTSTVLPGEVGADFIGSPLTGKAPLAVQFTNLSAGDIGAYQWNFGDGGSSTETNPSHIYEDPGTYSVTLTVIGTTQGKIATKERKDYITALSPCAIAASLSDRGQINALRAIRDANLTGTAGIVLTSIYYRNVAEINAIFDERPDLRRRFKTLVADNGNVVTDLLQGRPAVVSPAAVADIIQYLEALKAEGSIMLQQDIDFAILGTKNGFLLNGLGITVR